MPTHLITQDSRLNYDFAEQPVEVEAEGCGLASNVVSTPIDLYDYYVPLTDEDRKNTLHTQPLPLSFLQIKEGDVNAGMEFYRRHYPKIPDELIEIMARYNFGDLKYATRKSIRNNAKKHRKSKDKKPSLSTGLTMNPGPHVITFD